MFCIVFMLVLTIGAARNYGAVHPAMLSLPEIRFFAQVRDFYPHRCAMIHRPLFFLGSDIFLRSYGRFNVRRSICVY